MIVADTKQEKVEQKCSICGIMKTKDRIVKNNKILLPQIKEHYENLEKYHKENNMKMPQKFINLYAKHLEAGTP